MVIFGQDKMHPFYKKISGKVQRFSFLPPFMNQVKEIQEELDKLSPHKIKHTKKV